LRQIVNLGNSWSMDGQGIDQAIARIEAALARINAAADNLASGSSASPDGSMMHAEVAGALKQLDNLIESLER